MQTKAELLPCPRCDEVREIFIQAIPFRFHQICAVCCDVCGRVEVAFDEYGPLCKEKAIAAWNRRASSPENGRHAAPELDLAPLHISAQLEAFQKWNPYSLAPFQQAAWFGFKKGVEWASAQAPVPPEPAMRMINPEINRQNWTIRTALEVLEGFAGMKEMPSMREAAKVKTATDFRRLFETLPLPEETQRAKAIEECAKLIENGRFLSDDSPAYRFAQEAAKAIRALLAAHPKNDSVHQNASCHVAGSTENGAGAHSGHRAGRNNE
jgi:hypothetical protein